MDLTTATSMINFDFSTLAFIPERLVQIFEVFAEDPLLYIPLVGWWFIFELYYLFHHSDEIREVDVLDNGLSALYTGIYISPIVQGMTAEAFLNPSSKTILSYIFVAYGIFLVIAAFTKFLPQFLTTLFGGAAIDLVATLFSIFYVEGLIPIDLATVAIIFSPILLLKIGGLLRKK